MGKTDFIQIEEDDINGKRVSNYRYNVYHNFEHGEFMLLGTIYCVSQTREKAEELILEKAKEMYEPTYNVSILATN